MLNEQELEKFDKTGLEFQLLGNEDTISADLKICIEENEKVTFSFYLEEKDYNQTDYELERLLAQYIFDNIPDSILSNLEPFTEFVYCDSDNAIFSYDYRFHIKTKDSLNRDRVKGKLFSATPRSHQLRLTDLELQLINKLRQKNIEYCESNHKIHTHVYIPECRSWLSGYDTNCDVEGLPEIFREVFWDKIAKNMHI